MILLIFLVLAASAMIFLNARQQKQQKRKSAATETAKAGVEVPDSPGIKKASSDNILPEQQNRRDETGTPVPRGALRRLGNVRLKHGLSINDLLFTPDGKNLISCGDDDTVDTAQYAAQQHA